MIISASRRTDIPAFYSSWFFNRLREGYVLVRNPWNLHLISKVSLRPRDVDCIVFWTKNPLNLLPKLDLMEPYTLRYYFLFTVTAYGRDIETCLPEKENIIETFVSLSRRIGRQRIVWRYDPIFLTKKITPAFHYEYFRYLADRLFTHTHRCIISFLTLYKKCRRNLQSIDLIEIDDEEKKEIAARLHSIASKRDIELVTCAQKLDLSEQGIGHGKCIDDVLISDLIGKKITLRKDKSQRSACRCVGSIDIGAYSSCLHNCLYCYANQDRKSVKRNVARHDHESPLLYGHVGTEDSIIERKTVSAATGLNTDVKFPNITDVDFPV
jgi:hypothetical protein